MELEITWGRTFRVWWAYLWRNLLFIALSVVAGFVLGAIIGFILAAFGASAKTIQLVVTPLSFILGMVISVIPLKMILGKNFGEFRVALVKNEPSPIQQKT